jgi:hypothetical protein
MNQKATKTLQKSIPCKHSPEAIFPLLCPVREFDWIEHWQCEILHTTSGFNEKGCLFRTHYNGPETWVTSVYEPNKKIEFVLYGTHHVTLYSIELTVQGEQTELLWKKTLTALDEEGSKWIASLDPAEFEQMVQLLGKWLAHYLDHGKMLTGLK